VGTIYEDIESAATMIASELTAHGYVLDFSSESLAEVDRFFDDNSALDPEDADAAGDSLLRSRLGQWMFALGAYSGEVLRRTIGGRWRWQGRDDDKAASTDTELVLVDGSIVFPFQRAWKRLMNGPDDSLAVWGQEMAAAVRDS
jgi:hypothetical protein